MTQRKSSSRKRARESNEVSAKSQAHPVLAAVGERPSTLALGVLVGLIVAGTLFAVVPRSEGQRPEVSLPYRVTQIAAALQNDPLFVSDELDDVLTSDQRREIVAAADVAEPPVLVIYEPRTNDDYLDIALYELLDLLEEQALSGDQVVIGVDQDLNMFVNDGDRLVYNFTESTGPGTPRHVLETVRGYADADVETRFFNDNDGPWQVYAVGAVLLGLSSYPVAMLLIGLFRLSRQRSFRLPY